MKKEKRKYYSAEEKVKILRRYLVDKVQVSDLCDKYGFHPTVFYRWQKAFFENGKAAFEPMENSLKRKLEEPGKRRALLPSAPLRTTHDSFPTRDNRLGSDG